MFPNFNCSMHIKLKHDTYQPKVKRRCVLNKLIIVLHIVISVAEFFHCVSVCVCVRERERERACVCVCVLR